MMPGSRNIPFKDCRRFFDEKIQCIVQKVRFLKRTRLMQYIALQLLFSFISLLHHIHNATSFKYISLKAQQLYFLVLSQDIGIYFRIFTVKFRLYDLIMKIHLFYCLLSLFGK